MDTLKNVTPNQRIKKMLIVLRSLTAKSGIINCGDFFFGGVAISEKGNN